MLESLSNNLKKMIRKQGDVMSLLIYPLLIIVVYEVVVRYAFNSPTTWGFELTTFLYGIHYMFGLSYTDSYDGHVKVDVFVTRFSSRLQTILKIATNLVFFMPVTLCLSLWSIKYAYVSTMGSELNSTSWAPAIWPVKILMAVGMILLLLQGISNLLTDITALKTLKKNRG